MYNSLFNGYLSVVDKAIQSQIEIFTDSSSVNDNSSSLDDVDSSEDNCMPSKLYDTFVIGYITGFCNIAEAVSGLHEAEHKELSIFRKILKKVYGEGNIKTVLNSLSNIENHNKLLEEFLYGIKIGKEEATDLLITSKKLTPHRLFMWMYGERDGNSDSYDDSYDRKGEVG